MKTTAAQFNLEQWEEYVDVCSQADGCCNTTIEAFANTDTEVLYEALRYAYNAGVQVIFEPAAGEEDYHPHREAAEQFGREARLNQLTPQTI